MELGRLGTVGHIRFKWCWVMIGLITQSPGGRIRLSCEHVLESRMSQELIKYRNRIYWTLLLRSRVRYLRYWSTAPWWCCVNNKWKTTAINKTRNGHVARPLQQQHQHATGTTNSMGGGFHRIKDPYRLHIARPSTQPLTIRSSTAPISPHTPGIARRASKGWSPTQKRAWGVVPPSTFHSNQHSKSSVDAASSDRGRNGGGECTSSKGGHGGGTDEFQGWKPLNTQAVHFIFERKDNTTIKLQRRDTTQSCVARVWWLGW